MKHSLFKKVLSLVLCLLMVVTMVPLSGLSILSSAQSSKLDPICDLVSSERWSQIEQYSFWANQSEENKEIVEKIVWSGTGADVCFDTAVTLGFSLIPGYGKVKWVDWAISRGIDVFCLAFYHSIIGEAKKWIEIGELYCKEALDQYLSNANSNGEITNPKVAYEIYIKNHKGIQYYMYGNGFYTHIINSFVEERSNKVLYYSNKIIEAGINVALKAASPLLTDMFPKLPQICGKTVYEVGDLYGVLSAVEWESVISVIKNEFNDSNVDLEYSLRKIDSIGESLYSLSFAKKQSLTMTYDASSFYNSSTYKTALNNVVLTGDQRKDLVNVALSQVGYHEGNSSNQLNGTNSSGNKNYTEYGYWFGNYAMNKSNGHYYAWCAMFISWCARQARIPTSVISNAAYARADGSSKKGGYSYFHIDYKNRGTYTPQAGDLIFFDNWSHVGIVYKVANGKVYTVEGNNNNSVKKTSYSLNSSYIQCYGVPKYNSTQSSVIENAYKYDYYNGTSSYPIGTYKVKVNSSLNVRKGPSTNYGRISSYKNGDIVTVTATDGNWGYTDRGWICLDYTEFVSSAPSTYNSNVSYGTGNYVVTTPAGLNCRKGVGISNGVIKTLPHGTQFSVTQTDGAWGYSPEHGGWLCLQYASYVSALTPSLPVPTLPNLSTTTSSEIGVGEVISFKWDAVDTADIYNVKFIDANTNKEVQSTTVTGTNASFKTPYAGKFNVSVSASNSQHDGPAATLYGFTAKAPSTVTFKDWDGKVISTQEVAYGKDATAPTAPSRVGHTFTKWDGNYTQVRENQVVTATYTKNKYKVTFCDYDGSVISTQDVYYGDAATAPEYTAPTGYSFVKWDTKFDNIIKATTVKAVISWTSLYPLEISTSSAVQRNNKSYIVTSIVNNSPNAVNNARIIAVLKTKENKLLATVQSENISLAKGEVKNLTLTASYEGIATKAEIFVVKADNENIPLAKQLTKNVDQGTAWSSWSTSKPPADALQTQSRTEYRYRDKQFTTSTSSTLNGWTLRTDVTNPSVSYGSWSGWSAWQDSSVSSSDVREVKTQQVDDYNNPITEVKNTYKTVYNYYRYATVNADTGGSGSWEKSSTYKYLRLYELDSQLKEYDNDYSRTRYHYWYNSSNWVGVYKNSPFETQELVKSETVTVGYNKKTQYSYRTRSKTTTYYFWKWGDWSSWNTTAMSGTNNRAVETRTTYRYLANTANNIETTAGKYVERNGTVDKSYANRQALLFVTDKSGVSQFVGQTIIGADGSYAFKFKTKDEPTVTSGDYKVMLSIEGTSAAFELEPIKAPVPEYTVKFVDHDGTVVSEQIVEQGKDASVPAPLNREGYRFIGWDKSYTNIQGNVTINAQYEIKSFDVVFVDEINDTSVVESYNYGDTLVVPEVTLNDAYNFLGWDVVIDEKTKVTENMVVTAKFEKKMFTVDFLDFDGSILESKSIEYGDAVAESVLLNRDNYVFISWSPSSDLNYVTEDIIVTPIFEYAETVLAPTANITTGAYNDELVVTLSTETEGAKIYYTTDGTVPNVPNSTFKAERNVFDLLEKSSGVLYTEPFTIDSSANLIYVAVKDGMNSSEISQEVYAVNTDESGEKQHLVNVHYNITDETISYLVDDGMPLPEFNMDLDENGYNLTSIYTDPEYKNTWNADTDVVTGSMDIYLKWEKETYSVKFLGFDGKVISEQSVRYMEDAVVPEITSVNGYVFKYWDTGYTSVTKDITVNAVYAPENEVTTVVLNKDALTFIEGQSEMLTATVKLGTDCENDALIWQSSDENIVIVDDNGKITAVAAGTAIIFAISEDSGMSAQCEVTVDYKDPCSVLGHKHEGKVTAPTCTEKGYTTYICSVCGDTYTANEKASLGHNMSEIITIVAPSCENEGQDMIKCSRCDYSEIHQTEAMGHYDNDGNNACDDCGKELSVSSKCSCNCHKTGFMGFIWKILRFFYKLFGMNKVCGCGVAHY
ncbi:MAG: InlB B-repeat-containing protein [Clostridia bacterium]|nr:InlB B-repeat-containing protein [Clostridia bacterium]